MSKKTQKQAQQEQRDQMNNEARGVAKLQCLALICAALFITTKVGKPEVVEAPAKQATAQVEDKKKPKEEEKEYLLDGTWFEDTLIGTPIDAAWEIRRELATKALLGGF